MRQLKESELNSVSGGVPWGPIGVAIDMAWRFGSGMYDEFKSQMK